MINETKLDHLDKLLEEVIVVAKEANTEEDLKIEFEKKLETYFKAKPIDPKSVKKYPRLNMKYPYLRVVLMQFMGYLLLNIKLLGH